MGVKVEWKEEISSEQLERVKRYVHLLVHPMNVASKISSLEKGRGVLVADWFARDVLRAAELAAPPCTPDHAEIVAARDALDDGQPIDPVVLAILETSEHKLTILDGFETVCAIYADDPVGGRVQAHLLRLPI